MLLQGHTFPAILKTGRLQWSGEEEVAWGSKRPGEPSDSPTSLGDPHGAMVLTVSDVAD